MSPDEIERKFAEIEHGLSLSIGKQDATKDELKALRTGNQEQESQIKTLELEISYLKDAIAEIKNSMNISIETLKQAINTKRTDSRVNIISILSKSTTIIALLFLLSFLGYNKWSDLEKDIDNRIIRYKEETNRGIDKSIRELSKEAIPRQLTRSVASFKLYQSINDYVNSDKNDKKRHLFMLDINKYIDPDQYGDMQVRETILDNQAAISGWIPLLLDDLTSGSKEFKEDSHVAFWILQKYLNYTSEMITKENKDRLNRIVTTDKQTTTVIVHIYEQCNSYLSAEIDKMDNKSKKQLHEELSEKEKGELTQLEDKLKSFKKRKEELEKAYQIMQKKLAPIG